MRRKAHFFCPTSRWWPFKTSFALPLLVLVAPVTARGQNSQKSDSNLVRYALEGLQSNLSKPGNFQITTKYVDFKAGSDEPPRMRFQIQTLTQDSTDRFRTENIRGVVNPDGSEESIESSIFAFDGDHTDSLTTRFDRDAKPLGQIVKGDMGGGGERNPHGIFLLGVAMYIEKALSDDSAIDAQREQEGPRKGLIRISWQDSRKFDHTAWIDDQRGFVIPYQETRKDGQLTATFVATYKHYEEHDIWYVQNGRYERYFPTPKDLYSSWDVDVLDAKFNDPDFSEEVFSIDYPEGTPISDTRFHIKYTAQGGAASEETPDKANDVLNSSVP